MDKTEDVLETIDLEGIQLNEMPKEVKIDIPSQVRQTAPVINNPVHINNANTGEWNEWTKMLLKKISDKAIGYRWMHDREYRMYENIESKSRIVEDVFLAFVDALGGTTFVMLVSGLDLNNNKTVLIVVSIIQLILGIILFIIKKIHQTGDYQRKEQTHKYIAGKFYDVTLRIQTQFALDIDRRENDKSFLLNIISKFNDIIQLALPIEKETIAKYIKAKEENDITLPINITDFNEGRTGLEANPSSNVINTALDKEIERYLRNI